MKLIPIDWYIQSPIDFEHKQYVLFPYLQEVDNTYVKKVVSPHLFHLEKLEKDLLNFKSNIEDTEINLIKQKYVYFDNDPKNIFDNNTIEEIKEIIDFSVPQIKSRIQTGYKIAAKFKQILY